MAKTVPAVPLALALLTLTLNQQMLIYYNLLLLMVIVIQLGVCGILHGGGGRGFKC